MNTEPEETTVGASDLSDKLGAKLNVTAEIKEIFDDALAYQNCRDACIKGVFLNRRAVYHAKRYIQTSRKAWHMVHALWPQTKSGAWEYNYDTGMVSSRST